MDARRFDAGAYHATLCPDRPAFLDAYIRLPILRRLGGVGLLCGTDWTPLFHNRLYYSRRSHSIGVALIIWHFTHDRRQTVAGLLHDVATPAFSHVNDFRNGDALTQESTELPTRALISADQPLNDLLAQDGLTVDDVADYHQYPIADNAVPGLSADRLEYMYPSGAALLGNWTVPEVRENYGAIRVLRNERGLPELGFAQEPPALAYVRKFCAVGHLLQCHEDKVAMQLLADVLARALQLSYISERDLYAMDEAALIARFERLCRSGADGQFSRLFRTFRRMTAVERSPAPVSGAYCESQEVKLRYVDPLVAAPGRRAVRLSSINREASDCLARFRAFRDAPYGCVRWQ